MIEDMTARMIELASDAWSGPIRCHPVIDALSASAIGTRLEVLRIVSVTKLFVVFELARRPEIDESLAAEHGFELKRGPTWTRLTRGDDEDILVSSEPDRVTLEWSRVAPALDPERAYAMFASIPPFAPFASLTRPPARLRTCGVARDRTRGLLGLVTIDLDPDRYAEDEAILRGRGFSETGDPDDAIWGDGHGRWIAWAGGTIYCRLGPISPRVGAWD